MTALAAASATPARPSRQSAKGALNAPGRYPLQRLHHEAANCGLRVEAYDRSGHLHTSAFWAKMLLDIRERIVAVEVEGDNAEIQLALHYDVQAQNEAARKWAERFDTARLCGFVDAEIAHREPSERDADGRFPSIDNAMRISRALWVEFICRNHHVEPKAYAAYLRARADTAEAA